MDHKQPSLPPRHQLEFLARLDPAATKHILNESLRLAEPNELPSLLPLCQPYRDPEILVTILNRLHDWPTDTGASLPIEGPASVWRMALAQASRLPSTQLVLNAAHWINARNDPRLADCLLPAFLKPPGKFQQSIRAVHLAIASTWLDLTRTALGPWGIPPNWGPHHQQMTSTSHQLLSEILALAIQIRHASDTDDLWHAVAILTALPDVRTSLTDALLDEDRTSLQSLRSWFRQASIETMTSRCVPWQSHLFLGALAQRRFSEICIKSAPAIPEALLSLMHLNQNAIRLSRLNRFPNAFRVIRITSPRHSEWTSRDPRRLNWAPWIQRLPVSRKQKIEFLNDAFPSLAITSKCHTLIRLWSTSATSRSSIIAMMSEELAPPVRKLAWQMAQSASKDVQVELSLQLASQAESPLANRACWRTVLSNPEHASAALNDLPPPLQKLALSELGNVLHRTTSDERDSSREALQKLLIQLLQQGQGRPEKRIALIQAIAHAQLIPLIEPMLVQFLSRHIKRLNATIIKAAEQASPSVQWHVVQFGLQNDDARTRANTIELTHHIPDEIWPTRQSTITQFTADRTPRIRANSIKQLLELKPIDLSPLQEMLADTRFDHRRSALWVASSCSHQNSVRQTLSLQIQQLAEDDPIPIIQTRASRIHRAWVRYEASSPL